jgi:hypothetical protein
MCRRKESRVVTVIDDTKDFFFESAFSRPISSPLGLFGCCLHHRRPQCYCTAFDGIRTVLFSEKRWKKDTTTPELSYSKKNPTVRISFLKFSIRYANFTQRLQIGKRCEDLYSWASHRHTEKAMLPCVMATFMVLCTTTNFALALHALVLGD